MNKKEAIEFVRKSNIFNKWHFFTYHFNFYNLGLEHPLAKSIIELVIDIENIIPGAGVDYLNKIASINGRKNDTKHYEQLLQILAELTIVHKAVTFPWGDNPLFAYEPTAGKSSKNPELTVTTGTMALGIEVKSPELVNKHNERATKPHQLPSRSDLINSLKKEDTMLPRDNPIKDFLISADKKFLSFKQENENFLGILVIVWDDFVYEPISAISSPQSGLFTENSFARDKQGNIMKYPNVDFVIITRHLMPIYRGTRDEPLPDSCKHPLDYGRHGEFPFKIVISNPWNNHSIPNEVIDCFQLREPSPNLGAEYLPQDFIIWTNI